MLGQMVKMYFESEYYSVYTIDERFEYENIQKFINTINSINDGIVINCIGRIKQKSEEISDLMWSNAILPLELSRSLKPSHFLIHPSTDCVFSGVKETHYSLSDKHDAYDSYGWSKSLGETAVSQRNNSLVIRVSIIGPDDNSNKGLLSWFLNLPENSKINGFTNHYWNGITTLEWCKQVDKLIKTDAIHSQFNNVIQLGTEKTYTKNEMLILFQIAFNTNHLIIPFCAETTINRCLSPQILSNNLNVQLEELKLFISTRISK